MRASLGRSPNDNDDDAAAAQSSNSSRRIDGDFDDPPPTTSRGGGGGGTDERIAGTLCNDDDVDDITDDGARATPSFAFILLFLARTTMPPATRFGERSRSTVDAMIQVQ